MWSCYQCLSLFERVFGCIANSRQHMHYIKNISMKIPMKFKRNIPPHITENLTTMFSQHLPIYSMQKPQFVNVFVCVYGFYFLRCVVCKCNVHIDRTVLFVHILYELPIEYNWKHAYVWWIIPEPNRILSIPKKNS